MQYAELELAYSYFDIFILRLYRLVGNEGLLLVGPFSN